MSHFSIVTLQPPIPSCPLFIHGVIFWVIGLLQSSHWMIDVYWTVIPVMLVHYFAYHPLGEYNKWRSMIVIILTWIWSIRLTHNYFRFGDLRETLVVALLLLRLPFSAGALVNTLCLVYVTILVERRMLKQEYRTEAYKAYQKTTSVWIPWFKSPDVATNKDKCT